MVNLHKHFITYNQWSNNFITHVTLADGTSKVKIHGYGGIKFHSNGHQVTLQNVLYVPKLSHSQFSVRKYQMNKGNHIHFEDKQVTIAFPTFEITSKSTDEYYFTIQTHFDHFAPTAKTIAPKPLFPAKKLSTHAKLPTRSTKGSAGLDLYSSEQITPGHCRKVKTDNALQIPYGLYGRIAPRSGLSMKSNIDITAGVIDADYCGEIFPCLINNGNAPFEIQKHDKIAQMILTPYATLDLFVLESINSTKRENGGFGFYEPNCCCCRR